MRKVSPNSKRLIRTPRKIKRSIIPYQQPDKVLKPETLNNDVPIYPDTFNDKVEVLKPETLNNDNVLKPRQF